MSTALNSDASEAFWPHLPPPSSSPSPPSHLEQTTRRQVMDSTWTKSEQTNTQHTEQINFIDERLTAEQMDGNRGSRTGLSAPVQAGGGKEGVGLQFRHTDNINHWRNAMMTLGLPTIFHPETTDVYDKKNMPRAVYCIHALSLYLYRLGLAPQIHDLYGKVKFTVHAAVIAINEAVDQGDAGVTAAALRNPNAMLTHLQEALTSVYQEMLCQAKRRKAERAAGRDSLMTTLLTGTTPFTSVYICPVYTCPSHPSAYTCPLTHVVVNLAVAAVSSTLESSPVVPADLDLTPGISCKGINSVNNSAQDLTPAAGGGLINEALIRGDSQQLLSALLPSLWRRRFTHNTCRYLNLLEQSQAAQSSGGSEESQSAESESSIVSVCGGGEPGRVKGETGEPDLRICLCLETTIDDQRPPQTTTDHQRPPQITTDHPQTNTDWSQTTTGPFRPDDQETTSDHPQSTTDHHRPPQTQHDPPQTTTVRTTLDCFISVDCSSSRCLNTHDPTYMCLLLTRASCDPCSVQENWSPWVRVRPAMAPLLLPPGTDWRNLGETDGFCIRCVFITDRQEIGSGQQCRAIQPQGPVEEQRLPIVCLQAAVEVSGGGYPAEATDDAKVPLHELRSVKIQSLVRMVGEEKYRARLRFFRRTARHTPWVWVVRKFVHLLDLGDGDTVRGGGAPRPEGGGGEEHPPQIPAGGGTGPDGPGLGLLVRNRATLQVSLYRVSDQPVQSLWQTQPLYLAFQLIFLMPQSRFHLHGDVDRRQISPGRVTGKPPSSRCCNPHRNAKDTTPMEALGPALQDAPSSASGPTQWTLIRPGSTRPRPRPDIKRPLPHEVSGIRRLCPTLKFRDDEDAIINLKNLTDPSPQLHRHHQPAQTAVRSPNSAPFTCSPPPAPLHLFTSTCSPPPVHLHLLPSNLFTSTCSPSPVHLHLLPSTCSPPPAPLQPVPLHLFPSTCSPPPAPLHLFTFTCSPPPVHLHLLTSTCSPSPAHLHLNIK
ncbi:ras GTPase-activating-like protein IQGAP3 [Lates japonicus]|uniref:Ras GTPase-activating-like protein IQGAP3 n=1 Tax=Lates japonicus TaxID=270547 RepID=A0AAD3N6I1_LATJO|nr:ras GTPase-activating-like protein IQGAP3 [Lates japonicus]